MFAFLIIIASLASLALGYFIGYTSKGINITLTKPSNDLKTDADGNPVYNQSLLDLMPLSTREELDRINKGV